MSALAGPRRRGAQVMFDLFGYGLASGLALALDVAALMICHRLFGLGHLLSAAIGFLSGLALIYGLSVRYVFSGRRSLSGGAEAGGFLLTGLAGLLLTEALMYLFVDRIGLDAPLAKIPTSGLVFLFNFTARRALLFSGGRAA
ncbi:MAG: GtrA family protein [Methylocystis sp.]|uniref:GtrA family protein n=1 Tax=Methylocystis sp. TaxID=1911079 RepID=UPI003DA2F299